jgi:serine/threonine protein kinase/tetratricopeptide (TPR) repeat protein
LSLRTLETLSVSADLDRLKAALADRYIIEREIGRGGMATVYLAHDIKHDRKVAVKVLHPELAAVLGSDRFLNEIKITAKLQHPHILPLHDSGAADGFVYYVMPYVEGESLREKLERDKELSLGEAVEITKAVAGALDYAHRHDVIHRDIKPENILLQDGQPVVADFGIALAVSASAGARVTATGLSLGTPEYMSPEQATGDRVLDARSDVYALGCVLYEMLLGQTPFTGPTAQAIVARLLAEPVPRLRTVRPGVPPAVERAVLKALAKVPADRFATASQFARSLDLARRSAPALRLATATRKRAPLVAVVVLVAAAAIVVWRFAAAPALAFSPGDWILITDFDNHTGEEVFDRSLATALALSVAQSPEVSIYPPQRTRETLQRMMKPDVATIDLELGREVAEREGIDLLIAPSITRIGQTYALAAAIVQPTSGRTVETALVRAAGQDSVLAALDELGRLIRRELGEARESIDQRSEPLAKVTTHSLAALRQYTLGSESRRKAQFEDAKLHFERALRLDSTFTSAKAALGMLHFEQARWSNKFDQETGRQLIAAALEHVDDLPVNERYAFLTFSAITEDDYERAAEYQETLAELRHNNREAYNNLGAIYSRLGRYQDAIAAFREAIRIDPHLMVAYNGIGNVFLYSLGENDSALAWAGRQLALDSSQVWAYDRQGWIYLGRDSLARAARAFEQALQYDPEFVRDLYHLADTYRLQQRYPEAIEALERVLAVDTSQSEAYLHLGVNFRLSGDEPAAEQYFERYRTLAEGWVAESPSDAPSHYALAIVLAELGLTEESAAIGAKALALDSTDHFWAARLYAVQGRPEDALEQLRLQVEAGYWSFIALKTDIELRSMYPDPRFQSLMRDAIGR